MISIVLQYVCKFFTSLIMPPRKTKTKKKPTIQEEAVKFCPPVKDGYGAHWHVVIWIIVLAVLLSSVTMIYATFAFTARISNTESLNANTQLQSRLQNVNDRLDLMEGELQNLRTDLKPAEAPTVNATSTQ